VRADLDTCLLDLNASLPAFPAISSRTRKYSQVMFDRKQLALYSGSQEQISYHLQALPKTQIQRPTPTLKPKTEHEALQHYLRAASHKPVGGSHETLSLPPYSPHVVDGCTHKSQASRVKQMYKPTVPMHGVN
jgi:hypothetical protein